jgi:hypothetical protein
MANETARNYLLDLGQLVRERAEEAAEEARAGAEKHGATEANRAFADGRVMGYYEVLSLMQNQAEAFGIPLEDLKLGGFDPVVLLGSSSI